MSVKAHPEHLLPNSVLHRLRLAARDIKLAHSVFALPFAILGAFLAHPNSANHAAGSSGPFAKLDRAFTTQLILIIVCMFFARTWAMLINRLADRSFDAANPRTRKRVLASGLLSVRSGLLLTALAALGFITTCSGFFFLHDNPWPISLSLPVLAFIAFYSFTKRFTWACHLFLGLALAISPLAAAIAVRPHAVFEFDWTGSINAHGFGVGFTLLMLSIMVWFWVAGFDVIYALQDLEFDQSEGLWSIPARLGASTAIWVSRFMHVIAFSALVTAAASHWRFSSIFDTGVGIVGVLLVCEHVILAKRGKAGLDMAFFTINGIVSCVLGIAGVLDLTLL